MLHKQIGYFLRIFLIFSIVSLSLYIQSASAILYDPGETLEPACGPTDSNCGVRAPVATTDTISDGALLFADAGNWSLLSAGTDGKVLKLSDGVPTWGNDDGGTSYIAGTGLSLSGTTFALDMTNANNWTGVQTFGSGFSVGGNTYTSLVGTGLAFSGGTLSSSLGTSVDTGEITDSAVTAAKISDGTITFGKISQNGCVSGEIMKWNGSAWACSVDSNNTYTAGTGLSLASGTFALDINGLSAVSSAAGTDMIALYTGSGLKKITQNDLFGGVLGSLNYRGTWNATLNSPNLSGACSAGTKGYYYVVGTAGTTNLDGISSWAINDWAVCSGTAWQNIQTTNAVTSVFGRTGAITASGGDYSAAQITNTPGGNIAAVTVQNALNELDSEKQSNGLNSGLLWIGDASNQAAAVALSGDATTNNSGVLTIAANAVALGTDTTGNYIAGATANGGLTLTGTEGGTLGVQLNGATLSLGASGLALNLANANTWTATQTFNNPIVAPIATSTINGLVINSGALSGITGLGMSSGNFSQTGTGTFSTGTGTVNLNGNTIVSGALAIKKGADFSTTGTSTNVDFGNVSLIKLTGASAQTIDTITGGSDGKLLTIVNAGANAATIKDNSTATGTAANKIYTGTGADLTLAADASILLIYDSGASRWRVVGGSGSGSGSSLIQSISSTGSVSGWGYTVKADTTSASFTATLPTAANNSGKFIEIVKTDNSTNTLSIAPNGSETINGSTDKIYLYSKNDSVVIRSDGTNSYIVADNRSSVGSSKSFMDATRTVNQTTGLTAGSPVVFNSVNSSYGSDVSLNTSTGVFTLLPGKTYRLAGTVPYVRNGGGAVQASFIWRNITGNALIGSGTHNSAAAGGNFDAENGGPAVAVITPTVVTQIQLEIRDNIANFGAIGSFSSGGDANTDYTRFMPNAYIEVISTPQNVVDTVEYVYARPSTSIATANTTIPVTTALQGNISISSNMFSLKAGKTYELEAFMNFNGVAGAGQRWAAYMWTDASGTQLPGSNIAIAIPPQSDATDATTLAKAIITPTIDMSVKLMTTATVTNISGISTNLSYFRIVQIGSTASTGVALNSIIAATASGALDNQNYGQTWSWSTADDETALTMTGNALTTGGLLSLTSSNASLNSTNGLLYVANTGAGTSGMVAHIQSNSTAESGLSVLANGNVGIGTTSPAVSLHVVGDARLSKTTGDVGLSWYSGTDYWTEYMKDSDNSLRFYGNGADRLIINSVGKVGIGTTSPAATLNVVGAISTADGTNGYMTMNTDDSATKTGYLEWRLGNGTRLGFMGDSASNMALALENSADFIINGGNVGIGTINPSSTFHVQAANDGTANSNSASDPQNFVAYINNTASGTYANGLLINVATAAPGSANQWIEFTANGLEKGAVEGSGGNANYFSASDRRMKTNTVDTALSLDDLMKIHVRDFDWKDSGLSSTGFIAQELYEVYPEAVSRGDEGDTIRNAWMVDYGKITPLIVKAIQDQQAEIEAIKAKVAVSADTLDNLIISGALEVSGEVDLGKDSVGEAVVKAGAGEVAVTFDKSYKYQPVVTISKNTQGVLSDYYISDVTKAGFKIKLEPVQDKDITFSWHAFGGKDGVRIFSDGVRESLEAIAAPAAPDDPAADAPTPASGPDDIQDSGGASAPNTGDAPSSDPSATGDEDPSVSEQDPGASEDGADAPAQESGLGQISPN